MNFSKMVVALDRSPLDEKLIQYSHFIAKHFGVTSACFLHIVPYFTPPNSINHDLEKILKKDLFVTEIQQRELTNKIKAIFSDLNDVNVYLRILEGKPQRTLLTAIQEASPDLLVLGKKEERGGSGIIAQRVARKAKSAIWMVTEKANTNIQNILVPLDFSFYSLRALKTALHLKQELGGVKITVLYLIEVPITDYKVNKHQHEKARQLKISTEESYHQFLHQHQLAKTDFEFKMIVNGDPNFAQYIQQIAAKKNSDLIVISAKGDAGLDPFVLGSPTEKLITFKDKPPILVIR